MSPLNLVAQETMTIDSPFNNPMHTLIKCSRKTLVKYTMSMITLTMTSVREFKGSIGLMIGLMTKLCVVLIIVARKQKDKNKHT